MAATAPPGKPPRLREEAYRRFTRHLLDRSIRPGQFVSQRELAALTGLPLGAIRELVPRLEADGLIATVPQRGMQVAQIDLELVQNAFQYRLFLEREAIRLFAIRAADSEIARLRQAHEAILARAESGGDLDLVGAAQAVDWDLHDSLIDALGNRIVAEAYRVNTIKIRLIRFERTRLFDDLVVPVMNEHLGIIAMLEARNPERAARALTAHILSAQKRALG